MDKTLEEQIETENAFFMIVEFCKLGLLTKEEVEECMKMSREEWFAYMKKAAGIK